MKLFLSCYFNDKKWNIIRACVFYMFCGVLCILSGLAIISLWKRELLALLYCFYAFICMFVFLFSLQGGHSAILSTFIKLGFVFKIFVLFYF